MPAGAPVRLSTTSLTHSAHHPPTTRPPPSQWREAAADAAEERWALERAAAAEGSSRATPKKLLFALRGEADLATLMPCFDGRRGVHCLEGWPAELP